MLKLRSLELSGFLSHKNTNIPFEDLSYVIVGENASGKTSILRGIYFSLFGEDIVFGKKNFVNLINRQSSKAKVAVEFLSGGKIYKFVREILPKGNQQLQIFLNGEKFILGVRQGEKFIKEELGIEPSIFKNTVYVPQGELISFLEGTPKDRREILNRLFGFDEIAKKHEKTKEYLKKVEFEIKKYEHEIKKIFELEDKIRNEKDLLLSIKQETETLNSLLKEKEEHFLKQELLLKEMEKREAEYTSLYKQKSIHIKRLKEAEENLKSVEKKLAFLQNLEKDLPDLIKDTESLPILKNLQNLVLQFRDLKLEKDKLKREIDTLKDLKEKRSSLNDELLKVKNNIILLNENLNSLKKELEENETVYKNLEEKRKLHETLISEYSILEKNAKKLKNSLKEKEDTTSLLKEKEKLISEIETFRSRLAELEAKKSEHVKRLQDLDNKEISICPFCKTPLTKEHLEELTKESKDFLNGAEEEISTLKKRIENIKESIKTLEEEINVKTLRNKESEANAKKYESVSEEIKALSLRIKELSFDEKGFLKLQKELSDKQKEFIKTETSLKNFEREKMRIEKEIGEIDKKIKKSEETELIANLKNIEKDFNDTEEKIKKIKKENSIAISKYQELKEEIEKKEALLRKLENIKGRLSSKDTLLKSRKETEEKISKIEEDIKNIEKLIGEDNLTESSRFTDVDNFEKLKNFLSDRIYDKKLHEFIKEIYESIKKEITTLKSRYGELTGKLNEKESQLEKRKEELKELQKVKDKVVSLKEIYDFIKVIEAGFHPSTGFITTFREELLPEIATICKEIFADFNFDFSEITISEDLTIEFSVPGQGTITLDQLSGGQKVAFALALRFALARSFMDKFELLILDEPTIHLDEERKQELANILYSLKGKIPQMIVVTHDSELEIAGDKILRVVKTDEGSKIVYQEGE